MKRRTRNVLVILAAVAVAVAACVWLARDWPRRRVERTLAAELGASVDLDRLVALGPSRFEL